MSLFWKFAFLHVAYSVSLPKQPLIEIKLNRLAECPEAKNVYGFHLSMRKVSRYTTAYTANCTLKGPIDSNSVLDVEFARFGSSGWKLKDMPNWHFIDPCKTVNMFGEIIWKIEDAIVPPIPRGKCPVKEGFYRLDNYTIDWRDLAFQVPLRGRFLVRINLYANKTVPVYCALLDVIVSDLNENKETKL